MEKIRVAVAGFPGEVAMALALAICQSKDMVLTPHGLSESSFPNKHLKIACVYMEMYDMEHIPLFFKQDIDVVVDCFLINDRNREELYTKSKIPTIIMASGFCEENPSGLSDILDSIRSSYTRKNIEIHD